VRNAAKGVRLLLVEAFVSRCAAPFLVLAVLVSVSCTTAIHPPAAPKDPETIYLVIHGWSSSLVLHDEEGDASRWAYGDWRYYALGRSGILNGLAAVLWPTQSALGRQLIEPAPQRAEELPWRLGIGIDEIFTITVGREAVVRLTEQFDALFAANIETLHYNPEPKLEFVKHPRRYTIFTNSNSMIAEWLRELGCEVVGFPLMSKWRIEPPPPPPAR
jgi:hypothetical protein